MNCGAERLSDSCLCSPDPLDSPQCFQSAYYDWCDNTEEAAERTRDLLSRTVRQTYAGTTTPEEPSQPRQTQPLSPA